MKTTSAMTAFMTALSSIHSENQGDLKKMISKMARRLGRLLVTDEHAELYIEGKICPFRIHEIPTETVTRSLFNIILIATLIELIAGKMAYAEVKVCTLEQMFSTMTKNKLVTPTQICCYHMLTSLVHDQPHLPIQA